ncbi:MAG: hypothetical protein R3A45_12100 [Bdellovibrionota bacterium]
MYDDGVEVVDLRKDGHDQVHIHVRTRTPSSDNRPKHEATNDYPRMYLPRPSSQKLQINRLPLQPLMMAVQFAF